MAARAAPIMDQADHTPGRNPIPVDLTWLERLFQGIVHAKPRRRPIILEVIVPACRTDCEFNKIAIDKLRKKAAFFIFISGGDFFCLLSDISPTFGIYSSVDAW